MKFIKEISLSFYLLFALPLLFGCFEITSTGKIPIIIDADTANEVDDLYALVYAIKVDKHLKGKSGIADYLVNRWETYERWWTKEDPEKKEWIMWDVALIQALAHPDWAMKKKLVLPQKTPIEISIFIGAFKLKK